MMKRKIMPVILILMVSLLFIMTYEVKATSDNPITLNLITGNETTTDQNAVATNTNTATNNDTQANSQVIQPNTNQTVTNSNGNTLPQTGITEDITVMFFIVVCVVSAIYAYKKIRDYRA